MRKSLKKASEKSLTRYKTATRFQVGKQNKSNLLNTRPIFRKPRQHPPPATKQSLNQMVKELFERIDIDKMGFITATKIKHYTKISKSTNCIMEPIWKEIMQLGAITYKHYMQLCDKHFSQNQFNKIDQVLGVKAVKTKKSVSAKKIKCKTERQITIQGQVQNLQSTRKQHGDPLRQQLAQLQDVETHRGGEPPQDRRPLITPSFDSSRIRAISNRLDRQIRENNRRLLTCVWNESD